MYFEISIIRFSIIFVFTILLICFSFFPLFGADHLLKYFFTNSNAIRLLLKQLPKGNLSAALEVSQAFHEIITVYSVVSSNWNELSVSIATLRDDCKFDRVHFNVIIVKRNARD